MRLQILVIFFLGYLLFLSTHTFGQGYCLQNGGFTVTPTAGCAPLSVNVTNTVGGANLLTYYYGYVKGSNVLSGGTNATSAVFGVTGVRTILQSGISNGNPFYQCEDVTVYESGRITANFSSCGGGKINLSLTNDAILNVYDEVEILWGDGEKMTWKKGDNLSIEHIYASVATSPTISIRGVYTSQTACSGGQTMTLAVTFDQPQLASIGIKTVDMSGGGKISITYLGVTSIASDILYGTDGVNFTRDGTRTQGGTSLFYRLNATLDPGQVYKLKLASQDLCGKKQDSDVMTTMVLKGSSSDEKNTITWNQLPPTGLFQEYALMKDGTEIKTFASITETSYVDEDVQCGDIHEYQIIARTDKLISTSAPVLVSTTLSGAKNIEQAAVTVQGEQLIHLVALVPGSSSKNNYELAVERADAGTTTFKKITTLFGENEYLDQNVQTTQKSYCYRFTYQNSCGQKFPATEPICSILLTAPKLPTLSWTTEAPMLGEFDSYQVLQSSNSGKDEIDVGLNNSYSPKFTAKSDLVYTFQIQVSSKDGAYQSVSNILTVNRNANVYIPDAFSPDGDGNNELFEAKAELLKSFSLSVFNRWGQVVFTTDDITKGWDGTINGAKAPVGSYVYKLTVVDIIDQTVEKNGTFMLFR